MYALNWKKNPLYYVKKNKNNRIIVVGGKFVMDYEMTKMNDFIL